MSLALYRRYRPETFAEVIGQEHVTEPLQQAIRNGRVNHAYLFSGPRGCGKTTSARILARALNCEQGPTPTPCGVCRSCADLARGGGGGLDVVEIDAASHGGVDDARDLRDRVAFAPASARYKIYIIDEAHMVTTAGFNALLKVVEEPPEHVKFVFATTEPEKVIATIRSRTHHYPFRLVPPGVLREYVALLCEKEGVAVEPAVLPLVVRAGAGSVRDSLSVLDQLIAGSGDGGVTLARATALLGYTDAALLDDVVDAFAAHDGAAVFELVDRVIEGGHDPRRFVQDLLERLRDLVILAAVPDAGSKGLIDAPQDRLERMRAQAAQFGPSEVSRAADLVNTGLTEMRGATAPRLQLELICARVLLPGAGDGVRDLHARLDRVERRLAGGAPLEAQPDAGRPVARPAAVPPAGVRDIPRPAASPAGGPAAAPAAPAPTAPTGPAAVPPAAATAAASAGASAPPGASPEWPRLAAVPSTAAPEGAPPARPAGPGPGSPAPGRPAEPAATTGPPGRPASAPPARGPAKPPGPPPAAPGGTDITTVRRVWPDVLEVVKTRRRFTWMLLMDGVQVASLDGGVLALAFAEEGKRKNFTSSGSDEVLRAALAEVLRVDWRLDAVLDPGRATARPGDPGATSGPAHASSHLRVVPSPGVDTSAPGAVAPTPPAAQPPATPPTPPPSAHAGASAPPAWAPLESDAPGAPDDSEDYGDPWDRLSATPPAAPAQPSPAPAPRPQASAPAAPAPAKPAGASGAAMARAAVVKNMRQGAAPAAEGRSGPDLDDTAAVDDADAEDSGLSGRDLVARELGAKVIEEILHE